MVSVEPKKRNSGSINRKPQIAIKVVRMMAEKKPVAAIASASLNLRAPRALEMKMPDPWPRKKEMACNRVI